MKKIFFMAAVAALALSSCSSTEEVLNAPEQVAENAIGFDVYTGRTVSRASSKVTAPTADDALAAKGFNMLTVNDLANKNVGFGVFSYSTDNKDLLTYLANNTFPNFMYNQQVAYNEDDSEWAYSPVKYWPNEKDDLLSFQAFAPYKVVTTFHKDAVTGPDPQGEVAEVSIKVGDKAVFGKQYNGVGIRYEVPTDQYDLMWGKGYKTNMSNLGTDTSAGNKCHEDVKKPAFGDVFGFQFNHALSKVDVRVKLYADEVLSADAPTAPLTSATEWTALSDGTEVRINYVKLLGQLPSKGVLSLYDGSWTIESLDEDVYTLTTKDFTKMYASDDDYDAGQAVENATDFPSFENGVFQGSDDADEAKLPAWVGPTNNWMVIPFNELGEEAHNESVFVEISYDVKTTDGGELHNTSVVTNKIKSEEGITIAPNTHTIVSIHIGLTSAWFDATVAAEWNTTSVEKVVDATENHN